MTFYYQRTRAFLLLSPACVASYQPYYLDVARYARGNKTANLLNNQTKSGKESIDRFGLKARTQAAKLVNIIQSHF